jgi:hypothetical protein
MPSSSAPVDPEKLGHPVALTRGAEDGPASESANGSTAETPRGVSFATEETRASEESTQETTSSSVGGSTSAFDFAQGVSFTTKNTSATETTSQEKSSGTAGGLFSVPDFTQPAEAKEEEVFSPGEAVPGATIDSTQKPAA